MGGPAGRLLKGLCPSEKGFETVVFNDCGCEMTKRSILVRFGILSILMLSLLTSWQSCLPSKRIDSGKVREIALDHIKSSPYLENIDPTRVSITLQDDMQAYVVDFAWKDAGQIRPGLWAEGYYVVVDAKSGVVEEAHAYER